MSDKPWVHNRPEQRLSIATYRFLKRALLPPCYFTAIHDSDDGARTDLQRIRDATRGVTTGQLDWDIVQGVEVRPGVIRALARKLELKRGSNKPRGKQLQTIEDLTACGAAPVVAWSLREVHSGLVERGFRFSGNVETILQHLEAELASWDREADAVMSGEVVRKKSSSPRRSAQKKSALTWRLPD